MPHKYFKAGDKIIALTSDNNYYQGVILEDNKTDTIFTLDKDNKIISFDQDESIVMILESNENNINVLIESGKL